MKFTKIYEGLGQVSGDAAFCLTIMKACDVIHHGWFWCLWPIAAGAVACVLISLVETAVS